MTRGACLASARSGHAGAAMKKFFSWRSPFVAVPRLRPLCTLDHIAVATVGGLPCTQRARQHAGGGWPRRSSRPTPIPVIVYPREQTDDVQVTADAVGTVQALNTVTVRAAG